ncbi:MAG: lipopolysaccharide heptosyltransferase II, partial [Gammaproteobacteria bacterium]
MVMAQSLFKVLKAQDAERAIDVLAPGWTRALLERMPEVRQAIDMPLGHGEVKLLTRRRLGIALRAGHYQQVIVLPNSLKSALVPFWARIPVRSGYVGEMRQWLLNDCRRLDKQRLTMTV